MDAGKCATPQGTLERQPRILVVDDEPAILRTVARILRKGGYLAETAENGRDAFEAFGKGGFDLVISDFNMPKMNGLELLRAIKSAKPDQRVITHAGGLCPHEKIALRRGGVFAIIEKPSDHHTLLSVVKCALHTPFKNSEPLADGIAGPAQALARAIVVDDDSQTRDAMADAGEYLGLSVRTAPDAMLALALYMESRPDLVISDYHMPGMNGLQFVQALRAIDGDASIIIVSGEAGREEKDALIEAGAFRVLQKPVDLNRLSNAVNDALAKAKL